MIDDILDITQDSQTLGKPAMLDFVEGKVTIPYLLLHERVADKCYLESLYKKALTQEEIIWIKEQMEQTQALADSVKEAQKLGFEAIEAIKEYNNTDLENIMGDMINRSF